MKITNKYLKQIIQEEAEKVIKESKMALEEKLAIAIGGLKKAADSVGTCRSGARREAKKALKVLGYGRGAGGVGKYGSVLGASEIGDTDYLRHTGKLQ